MRTVFLDTLFVYSVFQDNGNTVIGSVGSSPLLGMHKIFKFEPQLGKLQ